MWRRFRLHLYTTEKKLSPVFSSSRNPCYAWFVITTSHLIYGWAAAKATERMAVPYRTAAFITGSLLPDVPIYTFFVIHTFILGTKQQYMWDVLYFESAWVPIFTLSHSLMLWPFLFAAGMYLKQHLLMYTAGAATLHVCLDFFVHNDDAYAHFWPLIDWKFISPISYWDPAHFGQIVGAIDAVVILGLLLWLGTKYSGKRARLGIGSIMVLYVASLIAPFFIF